MTDKLILLVSVVLILASCSKSDNDMFEQNMPSSLDNKYFRIGETEAISIAQKVLRHSSTRGMQSNPEIDYIIDTPSTRTSPFETSDTLAYIINFDNNGGFVIVSSDNRVYPVLGFSPEGLFSLSNEIAVQNFISNIKSYLTYERDNSPQEVSESHFDGCVVISPQVKISLGQDEPWNKYVIEEHPDCPAGCVAIATALVMSHSQVILNYHNVKYPMTSILKAINKGNTRNENQQSSSSNKIAGGYTPIPDIEYTYEQAVDSMAKIIYHIGKDVNMTYSPEGSGAFSTNAFSLCKSLNMTIPSGYATFNINDITQYINDDHIVYLRGSDINGKGGHAWVSDGCYFCKDDLDGGKIVETYIHCDWGWNGVCNGYYSGSVFEAGSYNFKPANYFAIKRNPLLSSVEW